MTEAEMAFYRLARERAFAPERFDRMNESARKTAKRRNELRRERKREYMSEYGRKRYAANRKLFIDRALEYYRTHRERINERRRKWTPERLELEKSKKRALYLRNREKILAGRRKRLANMTPEERDRYRERQHGYYVRYRDRTRAEAASLSKPTKENNYYENLPMSALR